MKESLADYCRRTGNDALLKEWNSARNKEVNSSSLSYGSKRKIWWHCAKGHEWQATVKSRVEGTGCPVCANRALLPGENDLFTRCPELASQWHSSKNGALTPNQVLFGSHRKVWWRCKKGHEWQARIASRTQFGAGCPVCSGKAVISGENDLARLFPNVANQWDHEKNGVLTPEQVSPYSNRRVWWRCARGHSWRTVVAARTMAGTDCPYCTGKKVLTGFNDLATLDPKLAEEWHPELNGSLTPEMVTLGSHHKVWWICAEGHVWQAVVYSRSGMRRCSCPICAGRYRSVKQRQYKAALVGAGSENGPVDQGK